MLTPAIRIEAVVEPKIGAVVSGDDRARVVFEELRLEDRAFIAVLAGVSGRLFVNNREPLEAVCRV
jgi:hypothetical protein